MVRPLTVYKASAGSGKTFTLATEYISLLVENPMSYRTILAVTFTNKATEEMKMRILSQLYGIWKQLPDSDNYLKVVQEKTGLDTKVISERAGISLSNLLNNYNYFRVETIDTFFQSVMRNMARELDLTTNLRIGLNDVQVEELAVDQLIADLSTTDAMLQWIDTSWRTSLTTSRGTLSVRSSSSAVISSVMPIRTSAAPSKRSWLSQDSSTNTPPACANSARVP